LNNNDSDSRIRRYNFKRSELNNKPNKSKVKVWQIILAIVLITAFIVASVKLFSGEVQGTKKSDYYSQNYKKTESSNNKKNTNDTQKTSKSESKKNSSTANNSKNEHDNTADNNNDKNNAPDNDEVPQKYNDSTFNVTHTFGSVEDAKNWATATQSSWLKDGYTNYTVTSDSQGYYILKFIK
jgi:cytoskeletal protein RodZ